MFVDPCQSSLEVADLAADETVNECIDRGSEDSPAKGLVEHC